MSNRFYKLRVSDVRDESINSVSLLFEIPDDLRETFRFSPGQYLTFRIVENGEELRRSYSICSADYEQGIRIAVKKVEGGQMSKILCDRIRAGNEIEVMPPDGLFTGHFRHDAQRSLYFIAAGSGITPILSLIKSGLEAEPKSNFHLLYGNRTESEIMFRRELDRLEEKYAGQFAVRYTLTKVPAGSVIGRMFGRNNPEWEGDTGRIDQSKLTDFLEEFPPRQSPDHYFICGPGDLIERTIEFLKNSGVDSDRIHKEYFFSEPKEKKGVTVEKGTTQLVAHLDGERFETNMEKGKTVLDTLIDMGADPPFSCTSGVCSTCMARVLKGSVEMETCLALDDDEIADGYILTCQSHPTSPELEVEYE